MRVFIIKRAKQNYGHFFDRSSSQEATFRFKNVHIEKHHKQKDHWKPNFSGFSISICKVCSIAVWWEKKIRAQFPTEYQPWNWRVDSFNSPKNGNENKNESILFCAHFNFDFFSVWNHTQETHHILFDFDDSNESSRQKHFYYLRKSVCACARRRDRYKFLPNIKKKTFTQTSQAHFTCVDIYTRYM